MFGSYAVNAPPSSHTATGRLYDRPGQKWLGRPRHRKKFKRQASTRHR